MPTLKWGKYESRKFSFNEKIKSDQHQSDLNFLTTFPNNPARG